MSDARLSRLRQKYRRSGAAQRHISAWGEGNNEKGAKLGSKRLMFVLSFRGRRRPFSSSCETSAPCNRLLSASHCAGSTLQHAGVATPLPRGAARLLTTVQAVVRGRRREAGVVQRSSSRSKLGGFYGDVFYAVPNERKKEMRRRRWVRGGTPQFSCFCPVGEKRSAAALDKDKFKSTSTHAR